MILYHLLTKTFPYGRYEEVELDGLLANYRRGEIKPLADFNSSVSAQLAQFIHRLLEIEPYKRFRNTGAIFSALSEIRESIKC